MMKRETIMYCMDEGTIKTPNPKCRLYWCLIEFIDWRYSQSAPPPPPPLPPCVNKYTVHTYTVWGGITGS